MGWGTLSWNRWVNMNRIQWVTIIRIGWVSMLGFYKKGDIVEIGMDVVKFGKTSLTLRCEVRNMMTRKSIISIDTITMVNLGEDGVPSPHNKTKIEFIKDRLKSNDD